MTDDVPLADDLVAPLLHMLLVLRAASGGDLEVNIILLTVFDRAIAHPDFRAMSKAERMAPDASPFPTRGVNVRSIAESTGMPRETVRRKVAKLLRSGWLEQTPQGLTVTPDAYRDLTPARDEIEQLAVRFYEIVARRRTRRA